LTGLSPLADRRLGPDTRARAVRHADSGRAKAVGCVISRFSRCRLPGGRRPSMLAWIPRRRVSMAGLRLTGPRLVPVGRGGGGGELTDGLTGQMAQAARPARSGWARIKLTQHTSAPPVSPTSVANTLGNHNLTLYTVSPARPIESAIHVRPSLPGGCASSRSNLPRSSSCGRCDMHSVRSPHGNPWRLRSAMQSRQFRTQPRTPRA
jgi:hypothetical protein